MKKEEMVIGKEYLHSLPAFNQRYIFKHHVPNILWGNFTNPVNGIDYIFILSRMTEAPQAKPEAKPEFEIDDEIEVSSRADFKNELTRGKFKYLDPDGDYWIAKNSNGLMMYAKFARKIKVEPMVRIRMCIVGDNGGLSKETWDIPKELADKIIAGDHSR